MIIFTWSWIFKNLKRTYQGCKLHSEFENKRKCIEHRKYKKRELASSLLLSLSLSFSVCLYLCLSVCLSLFLYLSVPVTHTYFTLFAWRFWNSCSVVRPLWKERMMVVESLAFLLSLPLTSCELPGKSFPWVSMDSGKRLSLVLWIVSKSWWMLFFFFWWMLFYPLLQ